MVNDCDCNTVDDCELSMAAQSFSSFEVKFFEVFAKSRRHI